MRKQKTIKGKIFRRTNIWLLIAGMIGTAAGAFFLLRPGLFSKQIRNIVLISIDTCRADYLSCYGYKRPTTPNIDSVASAGYLFVNAISPVPLTLPAHCSMLTGTIPPTHGVHDNDGYRLSESHMSLAEIMRANGFKTAGFVSAFVMDSKFGLDQGFDHYDDDFNEEVANNIITQRRGEETSRIAIKWLDENKDNKFFLFLHYYDPHAPYDPPEPFAGLYRENLYAGEIAYTDHCIGQVIAKLKSLGHYESTLIVITSDHGEMLGDHGELTHGYFIYQTAIRVPLIIKLPGQKAGARIEQPAGLVDIVPTICSLLNIQTPQQVQGKDLSKLFRSDLVNSSERYLFCESLYPTRYQANHLLGLVTDRWKYIQTARPELYDLQNDPQERCNVIEDYPQRAKFLKGRLVELLSQSANLGQKGSSRMNLDERSRKQLETLGYVGGAEVIEDFNIDPDKEDPKDVLDFHLDHGRLSVLVFEKKYDEAKVLCEKLLAERQGLYRLHMWRGEIAVSERDYTVALDHYRKAIKLRFGDARLHRSLGFVQLQIDDLDKAAAQFNLSLELEADHVPTLENLARVYLRQGRIEDAYIQWQKVRKIKPDNAEVLNNLAWTLAVYPDMDLHDTQESLRLAQRACELTGYSNASMLDTLAVAYGAAGDFSTAAKTAQNAYELARSDGQTQLARQSKHHFELFKSSQPFRMSNTSE